MSREGWGEGLVILARSVSVRMLSRRHGGGGSQGCSALCRSQEDKCSPVFPWRSIFQKLVVPDD